MSTDPRREAFDRVRGRFEVRVLEPSPPPVLEAPWFADDPVAPEPRATGLPLVSPVANGDRTWDELAREEPDLAPWCRDRWLGAWRRLPALPGTETLVATRRALHAVAEQVLAPARRRATGRIGLRYTVTGFGTPFYGGGEQARVAGDDLVVVRDGRELREPLTTVADAARLVGIEPGAPADLYRPETDLAADAALDVDRDGALLLADWFGFACSALEELRAGCRATDTRSQLWPEHFDLSIDLGDEAAGTRGTFGASPGDESHAEPYLYVTHWSDVADDPFWNDPTFRGASLGYGSLLEAGDQRAAALTFFRSGLDALGAPNA